jgi:hypothetical protein
MVQPAAVVIAEGKAWSFVDLRSKTSDPIVRRATCSIDGYTLVWDRVVKADVWNLCGKNARTGEDQDQNGGAAVPAQAAASEKRGEARQRLDRSLGPSGLLSSQRRLGPQDIVVRRYAGTSGFKESPC